MARTRTEEEKNTYYQEAYQKALHEPLTLESLDRLEILRTQLKEAGILTD